MGDPNYFDRIRIKRAIAQIIALLERATQEHIATRRWCGFEFVLWKRGIEISRPASHRAYTVYVVGWWPPLFRRWMDGMSTYTSVPTVPLSQLSKSVQRRIDGDARRAFVRKRGRAGWALRFVSRGYEYKIPELVEQGYQEVDREG